MNHLRMNLHWFITFHVTVQNISQCKFIKVCLCHGLMYFLHSGAPNFWFLKVVKLISEAYLHADSQAFQPSWHLTGGSDPAKRPIFGRAFHHMFNTRDVLVKSKKITPRIFLWLICVFLSFAIPVCVEKNVFSPRCHWFRLTNVQYVFLGSQIESICVETHTFNVYCMIMI